MLRSPATPLFYFVAWQAGWLQCNMTIDLHIVRSECDLCNAGYGEISYTGAGHGSGRAGRIEFACALNN
jgi:hypothetical protein